MSKEELISDIEENLEFSIQEASCLNTIIKEFFSQNVCIPKGENRYPYADVLHEWIEGAEAQFSINGQWIEFSDANEVYAEVRIKPPEPVYEWQWLDINPINHKAFFINEAKFMTEEECNTYTCYTIPIKIEVTKQVRNA